MAANDRRAKILAEAWIGDAVLSLYVRQRILRKKGKLDSSELERFTSNQALTVFGEPSEVEADIGRVYAAEGLEAAFVRIEAKLMPVFRKQEEKRLKAAGSSRKSVVPS